MINLASKFQEFRKSHFSTQQPVFHPQKASFEELKDHSTRRIKEVNHKLDKEMDSLKDKMKKRDTDLHHQAKLFVHYKLQEERQKFEQQIQVEKSKQDEFTIQKLMNQINILKQESFKLQKDKEEQLKTITGL